MKAAMWNGRRDVRVEDVCEPADPSKGEVIVKVKKCGICGTDLHEYLSGPYLIPVDNPHPVTGYKAPIIMAHEFSGDIVAIGPEVKKWKVGDRVAIQPNYHCGKCYYCQRGLHHLCTNFYTIGIQSYWGGFAEYTVVQDYMLNKLPDNLTYEQGAMVEPAALALYGIKRGGIKLGDTVLITGGGPTAVLMLMGALAAGAYKVFMTEVLSGRLKRLEKLGATKAFNPLKCDLKEEILKRTDGIGVDVAIDCTGNETAINDCFELLRKRGMYVQSGLTVNKIKVDPFKWALKDLNMVGIWCYYHYDFPSVINLIDAGKLPVEKLITKTIGVDDIVEEGFEVLTSDKEGKELKILVSFG